MFSWVSLLSNLAKLGGLIAGLFRDKRLREAGRNEVAAESAAQAEEARRTAHDKIRNSDDATAAARGRVRTPYDTD